ncbi:MAG: hypothetical protein ABI591_22670 [Kofleriaceae bacterium]
MKSALLVVLVAGSDPPPPTLVSSGELTAKIFSDPAQIQLVHGDTIV